MAKRRPDPRKVGDKKLLRGLKAVAAEFGATFKGFDGAHHYLFDLGGSKVRAPSTPMDDDTAIKRFRAKLRRTA